MIETPCALQEFVSENLTRKHGYKPSRAMRFCLHLMTYIQKGQLDLVLPNGATLRFGKPNDEPRALLRIHNDRVAKRFLMKGQLGFCEAYLDGDWSSPDMALFFELILRNAQSMKEVLLGKRWARVISYVAHKLKPNSKRGSRKNIYSHYDIGNDFYAEWLDPSMTYSSALFADGITDLEEAQARKYQEMVERLELKPEHHVLEIGCGWGGFAEYAAKNVGCKITAITVSEAQHEYATKRIKDAGLSDKVEIRMQDYRDVKGKFDRIASIEMFEAVGEAYWPTFFETLKNKLKKNGRAVLQIITIRDEDFENYRKSADYIQRYIFPGGMLPSMTALKEQISAAGLKQGEHISFGRDYARTLKLWNEDFEKAWPKLNSEKLNTRFKRLWEQYLCYCEAGFNVGSIDVIQINIDKP
ncbi:MAG: cyclopropane-fatty-acyl-phospholipid synthase family protein [Pseudomonadota bacterium]